MKKYFLHTVVLLVLLGCFITNTATAKSRWGYRVKEDPYFDFGYCIGMGNYVGDLVPSFFYVNQLHPYNGFMARYNLGMRWSLRTTFNAGVVSGDDAKSKNEQHQVRNLSFRSGIQELSVAAEFNLLPYHAFNTNKLFSPYAFIGVAMFHFNPKANYQGQWIALQPLGTEGEGIPGYHKKYSLFQPSIPFGGGLKYRLKIGYDRYITLGGEIGMRKTFTDYLDDVSAEKYLPNAFIEKHNGKMAEIMQIRADEYYSKVAGKPVEVDYNFDVRRGDKSTADWYFWGNLSVSYVFRPSKYHFAKR